MKVFRPIRIEDLDPLMELVGARNSSLTTLQGEPDFLRKRIRDSVEAFMKLPSGKPSGESYQFVLEDVETGSLIGTSAIVSKVGGFEPFYAYRIETSVHESKSLNIRKEIPALHLIVEHNGPCEIGSLFLHPDYRGGGNGRLLSLARFMFMAEHPTHFDPVVIAEIRGFLDRDGHSPFWEGLGKHFFDLDFKTADDLSAVDKKFIADLMPTHPIYIPLLPESAQAVIGKPHPSSARAMHILESEGFEVTDMVDIFEAGPMVSCQRDEIRTIKESRTAEIAELVESIQSPTDFLICTVGTEFRLCLGGVQLSGDGTVRLAKRTGLLLNAKVGDRVRFVSFKPSASEEG